MAKERKCENCGRGCEWRRKRCRACGLLLCGFCYQSKCPFHTDGGAAVLKLMRATSHPLMSAVSRNRVRIAQQDYGQVHEIGIGEVVGRTRRYVKIQFEVKGEMVIRLFGQKGGKERTQSLVQYYFVQEGFI